MNGMEHWGFSFSQLHDMMPKCRAMRCKVHNAWEKKHDLNGKWDGMDGTIEAPFLLLFYFPFITLRIEERFCCFLKHLPGRNRLKS